MLTPTMVKSTSLSSAGLTTCALANGEGSNPGQVPYTCTLCCYRCGCPNPNPLDYSSSAAAAVAAAAGALEGIKPSKAVADADVVPC